MAHNHRSADDKSHFRSPALLPGGSRFAQPDAGKYAGFSPLERDSGCVARPGMIARAALLFVLLSGMASACVDPGEEGTGIQLADASLYVDARLDTGADTSPQDVPDVKPVKGCSHDNHCKAFGQVCDLLSNTCVQCLTDQNCPQGEFCLDNECLPDMCTAGETRCWGKPEATTHVALCKVNGGGWAATKCQPGTYCDEGKCIPLLCEPGALSCKPDSKGGKVMRCKTDGIHTEVKEDCGGKGLVCQKGKCIDTSCSPGEIKCASDAVSLVCTKVAGKWRFKTVVCED
ncbi:MAG: hypothetical protein KC502_15650, partial [Myxococcales bacterium]|nr:hypothetical protein [Myxococcales bacterium]